MRALTFSGILLDTGDMTLEPGFVVEGEPANNEGELTVEVFTRSGKVIATTHLPLVTPCGYPSSGANVDLPARVAAGLVEFPENANGLRVILEGRTLLERTAPRAKGTLKVDWPNTLTVGTVSVRWRASQKGAIASLGYSNDNGKTWSPLSLPTATETITFDAEALPGGKQSLLELAVTDGFRTTRVQSQKYSVEPKGWVLWILSPSAGAVLRSGESVLLAAQGYHLEERRPSFDEITWTSSLDGGLGRGAQVMVALSPGEHTIKVTMQSVSAEIQVSVTK